jgi:hypothetical protein
MESFFKGNFRRFPDTGGGKETPASHNNSKQEDSGKGKLFLPP